jgi:hypothetical protein
LPLGRQQGLTLQLRQLAAIRWRCHLGRATQHQHLRPMWLCRRRGQLPSLSAWLTLLLLLLLLLWLPVLVTGSRLWLLLCMLPAIARPCCMALRGCGLTPFEIQQLLLHMCLQDLAHW